jgi:hypothetical protein
VVSIESRDIVLDAGWSVSLNPARNILRERLGVSQLPSQHPRGNCACAVRQSDWRAVTDTAARNVVPKVSVLTLAAMVVGSMVGGGVFTLPQGFGAATGVLGALIAWTIAGLGMLMLAFVFQSHAVRRPDLDSGIYIYAQAGFGNYCGFNAAWGYWASNVVGNVFFIVFAMASIGEFVPSLSQGNTVLAVLLASAGVWTFHVLIARESGRRRRSTGSSRSPSWSRSWCSS